jgi:uncharacterized heparinase superfamily protein
MMEKGLRRAAAEQGLRRARAALSRFVSPFGGGAPARLHIAPQDLRTSDPTIAADIYGGQLKFAGKLLETHGQSPFEIEPPSDGFAAELNGFGWLRHLRAAETPLARSNGRTLVADWIAANGGGPAGVAGRPEVAARRLISWLSHTPLLLEGSDAVFYATFTRALGQEAKRIRRMLLATPPNETRLMLRIALTHFALCCYDDDRELKAAASALCDMLDTQIMPDGSHPSRDPSLLVSLLLDLLPLKLAFLWRRIQTPQPIISAIDRMLPLLRMMRHADGALALFNGAGATSADLLAAVLAQDDVMAQPPSFAPYAGYHRVEAGSAVLLVDAGAPPPPPLAGRCHGAPTAFEFSADGHRIIVNCGAPPAHRAELSAYARVTAAHSTLSIGDSGIGRVTAGGKQGEMLAAQYVGGATRVDCERADTAEGAILSLSHDGYQRGHRLIHQRRLALSSDGGILEGEDSLIADGRRKAPHADAIATLRFHLHPLAKATLTADKRKVYISLPNRAVYEFEADGRELELEESVFFASAEGLRRTEQITIAAPLEGFPPLAWRLRRGAARA